MSQVTKMGVEEDRRYLLEVALIQSRNGEEHTGDGSVDLQGKPVPKRKTGNWRACSFILGIQVLISVWLSSLALIKCVNFSAVTPSTGTECCERLAFCGIATNLVSYLTGTLHEGNVYAARNVNIWQGTCYFTPLIGAVLADAYWGRYWTIVAFSTIYFIGMCTLTLSASVSVFKPAECVGSMCPSATPAQYGIFFLGLYLIAIGTGGIKPCVSSFGADQFDDTDPKERVKKGSFFNWFYFFIDIGALASSTLIVWTQENVGWALGFGIPALFMGIAIASFFIGTPVYRFQRPGKNPLTRLCQVVVASLCKCKLEVPNNASLLYETPDGYSIIEGSRKLEHTEELKFLDKAAVLSDDDMKNGDLPDPWRLCTVTQVEELKILIRMFPIWATGIVFSAVYSQMSTMFIEQGMVMDRTIGSFAIPAASLSTFDVIVVIFWVPIYDQILVPIARKFTGKERGFSELQRIGIGYFISILAMVAAATVEIRRLQLAKELGFVDENAPVPFTIFWQIPQFILVGVAESFTFIGAMEFFYDQSPDAMRSLCTALFLLTISLGSYLSSLILTIVTTITSAGGRPGWIPDNLNKGRLDNFFWLLAGLSFFNMVVYVFYAMRYKQKKASY